METIVVLIFLVAWTRWDIGGSLSVIGYPRNWVQRSISTLNNLIWVIAPVLVVAQLLP